MKTSTPMESRDRTQDQRVDENHRVDKYNDETKTANIITFQENSDYETDPEDELDLSHVDPTPCAQRELIKDSTAVTELEIALQAELKRKETHIERLIVELKKLKQFISKRKQTYKRKRKEDGAPMRALSAYNLYVQERFSKLAKENEAALKSDSLNAELKRVPPASIVARTGNEWSELPTEEKARYEERAREDRKRYKEEMSHYQPPEKDLNKKRLKTGYNMFFAAHVQQLKQSENGVPSERGCVARIVGNAWKELPKEAKLFYEKEADEYNKEMAEDENETTGEGVEVGDPRKRKVVGVSTDRNLMDIAPSERLMIMPPPMTAPVVHHPHHDPRSYTPGPYLNYYEYPPPGAPHLHPPPSSERYSVRMSAPPGYPPFLHSSPHGPMLSPPGGLHYPHPYDHRPMS